MYRISIVLGLLLVAVVAVAHFALVGRGRPRFQDAQTITRFNLWERLVHAVLGICFVVLAGTGFWAGLAGHAMSGYALMIHATFAPPFILALTAMALTWAYDCRYQDHDLQLVKSCPLCQAAPPQAGRFNTIQKTFFWITCLLAIPAILSAVLSMFPLTGTEGQHLLLKAHRASTLLMTMFLLGHAYLQTCGRRGTWQVMVSGKVSPQWAQKYAPLWGQTDARQGLTGP